MREIVDPIQREFGREDALHIRPQPYEKSSESIQNIKDRDHVRRWGPFYYIDKNSGIGPNKVEIIGIEGIGYARSTTRRGGKSSLFE